MHWRYQAVYSVNDDDIKDYSLCEIFLDENGKLETWTKETDMAPSGSNLEELLGDLQDMIDDVREWKSVPLDSLCVGMVFERNDD